MRVGNGAADQVQLDVYGAVLESIWLYVQEVGHLDGETGRDVAEIADYVAKHWSDRDSGIWEVRSEETHFIQSKALCCVALDRACALAERGVIPDRSERWRAASEEIREFVDANGLGRRAAELRARARHDELDASLLTLAILAYDSPGASGSRAPSRRSSASCARGRTSTATSARTASPATKGRF